MSGPGFSLTELFQAISKCKNIYDTFKDEYESAPARIRELVDTCKYLRDVLEDFKSTVGDVYSQEHSFGRKLDECNAFINKYKSLKEDYLKSEGETTMTTALRQKWEQVWQTATYAFDSDRARDLKDALSLEMQKLVLFILVFALKRTVPVNPSTSVTQRSYPIHRRHMQGQTDFEELFARLQSVRYIYEREMYNAVRQGRPPNLIGLHAELESGWHALCVRAGLAHPEGEAPPLQTERLLEAPSRNMNDLVITLGLPSMHTTLQPWANRHRQFEPQLESQVERQQETPSVAATASPSSHRVSISSAFSGSVPSSSFGNTTPLYPERPYPPRRASSFRLPDPEMPYHVATITLPIQRIHQTIRLRQWECHISADTHKIVWTADTPPGTLEHYIPSNTFPDTLHSEQAEEGKELNVKFSQAHEMIWRGEDGVPHDQNVMAEYLFIFPEARKEFQEDVRYKVLVETWDFGVLWSTRISRQNGGEAVLQDLKVWQDRHYPYHHSLSFFASTREWRHLEFPLLDFHRDIKPEPKQPKVAHIDFVRRRGSSTSADPKLRRRSTLFRPPSSLFHGKSPPKEGNPTHKKRTSISSATPGNHSNEDIPNEFGFLAIKFSNEQDLKSFKDVFVKGYDSDARPTTFEIGSSPSSKVLSNISPVISPTQYAAHPIPDQSVHELPQPLQELHSPSSPRSRPMPIPNPGADFQPPGDLYSSSPPRSRPIPSMAHDDESPRARQHSYTNNNISPTELAGSPFTTQPAELAAAPSPNSTQNSITASSPQLPELEFQNGLGFPWDYPPRL